MMRKTMIGIAIAALGGALMVGMTSGAAMAGAAAPKAPTALPAIAPVTTRVTVLAAAPATASATSRPACGRGETVVFSCPLRNGKQVAVCIAKDAKGAAFGQYRYGARDKPAELAWPSTPASGALDYATEIYSGGGEQQISFARSGVRYTVFSRVVRTNFTDGEPNNPAISDGLIVTRGGRKIATYACTGNDMMPVQMAPAERHIHQVKGLFLNVDAPR